MRRLFLCCLCSILLCVTAGRAEPVDDLHDMIQSGKWDQAADELAHRNDLGQGDRLFLQGLVERDGDRAARHLRAALNEGVDRKFQEEIYFRLVCYNILAGDYDLALDLAHEYRSTWERGKYRSEIERMTILAQELTEDYQTAVANNDRFLERHQTGSPEAWGWVDRARLQLAQGKVSDGLGTFERLSQTRSDIAVPQSMYILALDALEGDRTDDASRYYGLLSEEYPDAIGNDLLARRLARIRETSPDERPRVWLRAIEGKPPQHYAVQVGAFSRRELAQQQAERLEREELAITIERKEIDGRSLHVVYLGNFVNPKVAEHARQLLEDRYGEDYKVVQR